MKQTGLFVFVVFVLFLAVSCGGGSSDSDGDTDTDAIENSSDGDSETADGDVDKIDGDGDDGDVNCHEVDGQSYCSDAAGSLIWQNKQSDDLYSWASARTYCENLEWAGFNDWRLPTISELRSLIEGCPDTEIGGNCRINDDCTTTSCLNDTCTGCESGHCYWRSDFAGPCDHSHWSDTSVGDSQGTAWFVGFYNGGVNSELKTKENFAMCVRGQTADGDIDEEIEPDSAEKEAEPEEEKEAESEDIIDGDAELEADAEDSGTISCFDSGAVEICADSATGYEWQNPSHNSTLSWADAITYCQNLEYGNHDDWRLPTISELRTLIIDCEDTVTGGACDVSDACPNYTCMGDECNGCNISEHCFWDIDLNGDCSVNYWSSTAVPEEESEAWFAGFYYAAINTDAKTTQGGVRCVRND